VLLVVGVAWSAGLAPCTDWQVSSFRVGVRGWCR